MNLLKTLFCLFILTFPFGELTRVSLSSGVAISLTDLILGLLVATWLLIRLSKKNLLKLNDNLSKPILFFIFAILISLIVNTPNLEFWQVFVSSLYLVQWIFYAMLYFITKAFDQNFQKKIYMLMTVTGLLIILGGYLQYFIYPDLRNLYYLGWDEHLYRMFGSFLDPNFLGTFLVLYLVFVTGFFLIKKREKQTISLFILSPIIAMTVLAIFLTYSRSALIMFLTSASFFLILQRKIRWLLVLVLIAVIGVYFSAQSFKSEGTNILRTTSTMARFESVQHALRIINDNPIFGVGFNAYRYAQIRYGFLKEKEEISHSGAGTDNSFLFVLATTGIVGLVAFIHLLFRIFIDSWEGIKSRDFYRRTLSTVMIASLGGLIVNSFFLNSLFYQFIMAWMWIILGLSSSRTIKAKVNKKR